MHDPAADAAPQQVSPPQASSRIAWAAAAVAAVAAASLALVHFREAPPEAAAEIRLELTTPPSASPESVAISPDGRLLVYAADADGATRLWLRGLEQATARVLEGTDGARRPFWSPDSRNIGFFAQGRLKRVDVSGGAVQTLGVASNPLAGTWNQDDIILFDPVAAGPIQRVSARGGTPEPATQPAAAATGHHRPRFLSDGRQFLFAVTGAAEARGIYLGQLGTTETWRLVDGGGPSDVVRGHLVFLRGRTLFAQPFDLQRRVLTGTPAPLVEDAPSVSFSTSLTGTIVYRAARAARGRQLTWFDRSGTALESFGGDPIRSSGVSLSPDDRRVAFASAGETAALDVWLLEARGGRVRVTSSPVIDNRPVWSPDGVRLAFESYADGPTGDLYQVSINAPERRERLVSTPHAKFPSDWSRDGRFVLYDENHPQTGLDVWAVPVAGDRTPFPLVVTSADELGGQLSPDGAWLAYASNESGRFEVYVQAFPGPGGKIAASTSGGSQPRWSPDGGELFFIAADDGLTSVRMEPGPDGRSLERGATTRLFTAHVGALGAFDGQQVLRIPGRPPVPGRDGDRREHHAADRRTPELAPGGDEVTLTTGTRLGAYDIVSLLGEGGMGAVYRARDTVRILRHLGIPTEVPAARPARAPPLPSGDEAW